MSIYKFRPKRADDPRVPSTTNQVTGPKIASTALKELGFTGHNLAGACTLTGAKVGDVVTGVVSITDGGTVSSSFESVITVADQIQQSAASDLSAKKFATLLLVRS